MPSHQPGHTFGFRAGGGVDLGISLHTLVNQQLDPEPACTKAEWKGGEKCFLASAPKGFAQTTL